MHTTARVVAKDFLQSVVIVDDQAELGRQDPTLASESSDNVTDADEWPLPVEAGEATSPYHQGVLQLRTPQSAGTGQVPEQSLDAKMLVDGFAEEGLVCAVIRPGAGESPVSRTVLAAKRADIVILDWELNGDDGKAALEIVHELMHEQAGARLDGQLRLIAFYSGAPALRQIIPRVGPILERTGGTLTLEPEGEFILKAGAVRIVVFAKATMHLEAADEALRARVVAVGQLPARLVDEFAAMATGLVHHVALASLAALRRNTHRLLARLGGDLDPAYLWHRATQSRPADAEEHLVELLAGELRAVLEDERVGDFANIRAIAAWIERDGRLNYANAFGETQARKPENLLALLTEGAAGDNDNDSNKDVRQMFRKLSVERRPHRNDTIAGFASTADAARQSNERFAVLMSLRTRYERPPPRLELGTILARGRGSGRTWWLCVQPRCDSVRLKGRTEFPLLPLVPVVSNEKFDLLLPNSQGGYSRFRLCKKPADIDKQVFAVHPSGGDVVMAESSGKGFVFRSAKYSYSWVADLKAEQAQRVAQQLATEFSRVGLSESEWLRLWSTR